MNDFWLLLDDTHTLPPQAPAHWHGVHTVNDVQGDYYLAQSPRGWALTSRHAQHSDIVIDFSAPLYSKRLPGRGKEWLLQACKAPAGATILDATAGLGRDAWMLAAHGFMVDFCERSPVLALMLRQAVERARHGAAPYAQIAARLNWAGENAMQHMQGDYDVIYLDPMFPPRQKAAAVKKEMQALQALLVDAPDDAEELLAAALAAAPRRVVVKRALHAPALRGRKADFSLPVKALRFDVYLGKV